MKRMVVFISLIGCLTACERVYIEPNQKATPPELLTELWENVRDQYAYLEYKRIDWLAIRDEYTPLVNNQTPTDSLFRIMGDMLYQLQDGHVTLRAGFNSARNWDWYLNYPLNYNELFVLQSYLGNGFSQTGPFRYTILSDSIGYLRYPSFNSDFSSDQMEYVLKQLANTRGLIIDMRGNTGGNAENIAKLMAFFVDRSQAAGQIVYKSGSAPTDFTTSEEIRIAASESVSYQKPIVVLINRQCYSACNIFSGFMSQLSQVTLVGDTTGGGGGFPVASELSNGWQYTLTVSRIMLPSGHELEGGVPPDINIRTGPEEEQLGYDAIIEEAIVNLSN